MAKIDEMPEYRAKLPTHRHDLSHDFGFTCTTAHLLPVFHDYLNAGESVELGFNYFLRTQPLQSAAMSTLKTHVEYFFVPMQLLFQPFGSFLYGIQDEFSNFFNSSVNPIKDTLPVVDIDDVFDNVAVTYGNLRGVYSQNGVSVGENNRSLVYRLADMFGFDPSRIITGSVPTEHVNPNVFPYQYLAYNCIYQYYYRLDNREQFWNSTFNFDSFYAAAAPLTFTTLGQNLCQHMFTIKYRPLGNDYFTDVKVSPIVDVLNLNNKAQLGIVQNWLSRNSWTDGGAVSEPVLSSGAPGHDNGTTNGEQSGFGYNRVDPSLFVQTQFGFKKGTVSSNSAPNGFDISTANIRAMFANEKLWSITGRAKKHYDDQTLAHFGFKVPHDPKHQITCFGHDVGSIQIGEVISTSNTYDAGSGSGSPLAEIAGKGYGNMQGKAHKFTAPCHGVVMVIFSVVADRNYFQGVPKFNVMTNRQDLYQPEYDHLGMQPVFGYEVGDYIIADHANIYGWQYRYEQWKRRYNRVTSAFADRAMVGSRPFYSWFNVSYQNITDDIDRANTESYVNFLNLPTDINDIMLATYSNTWTGAGSLYTFDPFVVSSHISCKKLSTMSDYSLPRLDA